MSDFSKGILNLVQHCAQIKAGDKVLVLNQKSSVDPVVSDAIEQTVKESGAACRSLWGEALDPDCRALPPVMVDAILSADKVISNYAIDRILLDRYIRGTDLIYVRNSCLTVESLSSPHATCHWKLVRAILSYLEEICSNADEWRITSPAGTDIRGQVSDGSDVADAFFVQDAQSSRFVNVFPGEVFTPVGSAGANGKIVMEYLNIRDTNPWPEAAVITIENDKIKTVEGGRAEQVTRMIEENIRAYGEKATFLDSWHGGMNPGARIPSPENRSLRGATSGPAMMHFHLGRTKDPISAGNLFNAVELDGRKIIDNGKLLILEDQKILEAKRNFSLLP